MPIAPGSRLGPYVVLEPMGAGGMGEVYRAQHIKLGRDVAIKVLSADLSVDRSRVQRLEREARTASALNHPGIVTIYDIGEHDGTTYIAMELIDGRTLGEIIAADRIPIDQILRWAVQLADALAKAHDAGIVHRDVKPANVMVTDDGLAKILDFGIARPPGSVRVEGVGGEQLSGVTIDGTISGTPNYMAPEQLTGGNIDHRADQFAFGALVYELLCGVPAFTATSLPALVSAILTQQPTPVRSIQRVTPADIERVVLRCLEKDADARYASMAEVGEALRACEERRARARYGLRATLKRPGVLGALGGMLIVVGTFGGWWAHGAERRWAERDALDQIERLVERGEVYEAFRVSLVAQKYRSGDPALERLLDRVAMPFTVRTDPPGAQVWVNGYSTPDAPWQLMGVTPLEMRNPYALLRWRITLDGYEPFEGAPFSGGSLMALATGLRLDPAGSVPTGTVRIPGGPAAVPAIMRTEHYPTAVVPSFFLDRYEVTNREYHAFVAAGGYSQAEWWPTPFVRAGQVVDPIAAMAAFRDASGRSGPSTWSNGTYPSGEDDYPVSGLSWYEAAAYCAFAGRRLPTVYHWFRAIGQEQLSDILTQSNLDGSGKAPIGRYQGLAAYGNYDMAGNVKEWVRNANDEQRYILGAAWNEPAYLFRHPVAQDPWDRSAVNGVRCAVFDEPPDEQLLAPITPAREYAMPPAISDDAFELLRGMYRYDAVPLDARVERVDDSRPAYRRETVSIRMAYGAGRMEIHLLIPRDAAPPYQSVIWFPGDDVFLFRSSESFSSSYLFDFIPEHGRVLVHPVYSGMYERWEPVAQSPSALRDRLIQWAQDLSRTMDYLATRPDFDASTIAYYGFSGGAVHGPIFTATEPRLAAAIFLGGGLVPIDARPEAHPIHFMQRTRTPTLMINGEDDFIMPYELSQRPMLELLGAAPDDKRLARLEGGHIPTRRGDIVREVNAWLDRYLGAVAR